jgi:hypothetical protein
MISMEKMMKEDDRSEKAATSSTPRTGDMEE